MTILQRMITDELRRRGMTVYRLAVDLGERPSNMYRKLRDQTTVGTIERILASLGADMVLFGRRIRFRRPARKGGDACNL